MTSIETLLSISSDPLAPEVETIPDLLRRFALGEELFGMLKLKNGFYAFESALHVLPLMGDAGLGLERWNEESSWRYGYRSLADGLLFFAEDIFQDQFCLSENERCVLRFYAETGETISMADSVEEWARTILSQHHKETGWPFVQAWRTRYGPLPLGKRLMPKIPFFLGGEYNVDNFWLGDPIDGMRLKADLAIQTRNLPEGAQVQIKFGPNPNE